MNIRDALGGLPTTAIATYSQASYQVVNLPPKPGALQWAIAGNDPGAAIQGPADAQQVTVVSSHRSAAVGDIQLAVTFTPNDGTQPTVTTLPLTVFSAEIRDANNAPTPTLDVGLGNHVDYQPVMLPAVPGGGGVTWRVGQNGRIAITGQWPNGAIRVTGQSVSAEGRDGSLALAIRVGLQEATATVGIGVFDVRIRLDRHIGWVGVGEVLVCAAEIVPPDVVPTATYAWSASQHFQLMGDRNARMASLVANAPSGNVDEDWVDVALTWQGSTVQTRVDLTAIGVSIHSEQLGDPLTTVAVGESNIYRAVVAPPLEEVLTVWMGGPTVTVQQNGLAARVTGVSPSTFEGADGLAVYLTVLGAMTRALIPLSVYELSFET